MRRRHPTKNVSSLDGRQNFVWAGCKFIRKGGVLTPCCPNRIGRVLTITVSNWTYSFFARFELHYIRQGLWFNEITHFTGHTITAWLQCYDTGWDYGVVICCGSRVPIPGTGPIMGPGDPPQDNCDVLSTFTHTAEFFGVECDPLRFGWSEVTLTHCFPLGPTNIEVVEGEMYPETGTGTGHGRRAMGKILELEPMLSGRRVAVKAECVNTVKDLTQATGSTETLTWYTGTGTGTPVLSGNGWATWGKALATPVKPKEYLSGTLPETGTPISIHPVYRQAWRRICCTGDDSEPVGGGISTGTGTGTDPLPPPFDIYIPCCPNTGTGTGTGTGDPNFPNQLNLTFIKDPEPYVNPFHFPSSFSVTVTYRGQSPPDPVPNGTVVCPHSYAGEIPGPNVTWFGPQGAGFTPGNQTTVIHVGVSVCTGYCHDTNGDPIPWRGHWLVSASLAIRDSTIANGTVIAGIGGAWHTSTPFNRRWRKFLCRRPIYEAIGLCADGGFALPRLWTPGFPPNPPTPPPAWIGDCYDNLSIDDPEYPGTPLLDWWYAGPGLAFNGNFWVVLISE